MRSGCLLQLDTRCPGRFLLRRARRRLNPVATDALGRSLLGEFLGTGLLVTAVVGSGIAAAKLSPSDVGLQLLENTAATVTPPPVQ